MWSCMTRLRLIFKLGLGNINTNVDEAITEMSRLRAHLVTTAFQSNVLHNLGVCRRKQVSPLQEHRNEFEHVLKNWWLLSCSSKIQAQVLFVLCNLTETLVSFALTHVHYQKLYSLHLCRVRAIDIDKKWIKSTFFCLILKEDLTQC